MTVGILLYVHNQENAVKFPTFQKRTDIARSKKVRQDRRKVRGGVGWRWSLLGTNGSIIAGGGWVLYLEQ